jgi:hypothetical protein
MHPKPLAHLNEKYLKPDAAVLEEIMEELR